MSRDVQQQETFIENVSMPSTVMKMISSHFSFNARCNHMS